jgi:hypothetical protein
MKTSKIRGAAELAAWMMTILAVSVTVKFYMFASDLYQTPGGGFALPGAIFVPIITVLFSPALVLPWLATYRMWKGRESGWIFGFASCVTCAIGFFFLAWPLIAIPVLCLIVLLIPAVRDSYTATVEDPE